MGLRKTAFSGIAFTTLDMIFGKGMTFVATLILARILGPEEFGLIGMITVFITLGAVLVDSGFSSSLIRSQNSDYIDYSTVFFTNLFVSIVIYLLLFFLAPVISDFYHQPSLVGIIRVYCLSFIITAFSAIQTAILVKELQFRKIMLINLPSNLIGVLVGFILALNNFGVWSIVWMVLSTQTIYGIVVWLLSDWKPSAIFSKDKLSNHFRFGYKLMLSAILNTVFDNIYNVLIGRVYSLRLTGFYERAKTLNEYPVIMLSGIISKVSYPMLSKIQNDKIRVSKVFRQLIQLSLFITAPVMLCIAAVANPLFSLVLGDAWLHAVPFFQLLCLSAILYPIHSFNINILQVFGRSDLFLKIEIVKKILMVLVILISINYGIYSLLIGSVATSYLALIINGYYSKIMMGYSIKSQILDIFPIIIIAVAGALAANFVCNMLSGFNPALQVVLPLVIGILLYILISYTLKLSGLNFFIQFLKGSV